MKSIYVKTFEGKGSVANIIKKSKIDPEGKDLKVKGGSSEGISTELVR